MVYHLRKKLNNLYERARKSIEVDDLEHAAEYYKEILDENPNDWEAYFYSYLGEFTSYTNAQASSVADKLGNTIPPAYDLAIEKCDAKEAADRITLISHKTADKLTGIASTAVSLLRQYEGGNILTATGKVHSDMYRNMRPTAQRTILACIGAFAPLDAKLESLISSDSIDKKVINDCRIYLRKSRFNIANITFTPMANVTEKMITKEYLQKYGDAVKELDPNYEMPSIETKSSSGGCYVATCVYGSYDCPQVWTLRRYRDYQLAETWYGRAFIRIYYAISPTLVKWFGHTNWFKKMWRGTLDRMVSNLQAEGVKDTPYIDKEW